MPSTMTEAWSQRRQATERVRVAIWSPRSSVTVTGVPIGWRSFHAAAARSASACRRSESLGMPRRRGAVGFRLPPLRVARDAAPPPAHLGEIRAGLEVHLALRARAGGHAIACQSTASRFDAVS
jgi:hypothetical protein